MTDTRSDHKSDQRHLTCAENVFLQTNAHTRAIMPVKITIKIMFRYSCADSLAIKQPLRGVGLLVRIKIIKRHKYQQHKT